MAARAEFVRDACRALGLPAPQDHSKGGIEAEYQDQPSAKQAKIDAEWNVEDMPLPLKMVRDRLWSRGLSRLQLEFVVDNATVANIANGYVKINNEYYRAPLQRIRTRLLHLFQSRFEYKSQFWI